MNKKGFTLMEILVVIALLAILTVFTITSIMKVREKSINDFYNSKITYIETGAREWGNDNLSLLSAGCYYITVESLITGGYITGDNDEKNELINPINKQDSFNNHEVCVRYTNSTISLEYEGKTYYANNLIENGSFENGLAGWTSVSGQTVTIIENGGVDGSKHLKLEPTTTQRYLKNDTLVNIPIGNKFYVSTYYKKSGGGNAAYRIHNFSSGKPLVSIAAPADASDWIRVSVANQNQTAQSSGNLVIYSAYTQFNEGMVTYWDNILLVDLTATFGVGNEPSKEWCDTNINYFDQSVQNYRVVSNYCGTNCRGE